MYSDQHLPWLVVEYKGKNPNQQKKQKKNKTVYYRLLFVR